MTKLVFIHSGFEKYELSSVLPSGITFADCAFIDINNTDVGSIVKTYNKNMVVALGEFVLRVLTGNEGIANWRGSILQSNTVPSFQFVCTYEPVEWAPKNTYKNSLNYYKQYYARLDIMRTLSDDAFITNYDTITSPSYEESIDFLRLCIEKGREGSVIDYDIEIQYGRKELACIGFSYDTNKAICIPFIGAGGNSYFTEDEEYNLMVCMAELFSDSSIVKRGQNVIFDSHFMLNRYGIRTYNLEDTMIAQRIIFPELSVSLANIASIWTDIPYYKDEGKTWTRGGTDYDKGWHYNCLDVLATAQAHPKQIDALNLTNNYPTYKSYCSLIEPLTYMMERGIKVDIKNMRIAASKYQRQIAILTNKIQSQVGYNININSPKQLQNLFYHTLKVTPYFSKQGKPTVDRKALVRIANQGYKVAKDILEARKMNKMVSTFLDTKHVSPDGRMRCSYNPVGTRFGRISSSKSIFDEGTNMQNQPHDALTYFVADDGYVIYAFDMSQIENRIVAYIGNIPKMMHAFESGIDLHRLTAAETLTVLGENRTVDSVTDEERQKYGKQPNHAFNYGLGYPMYALMYEIPEDQAKSIRASYHEAYPELMSGYWRYVKDCLCDTHELKTLTGRSIRFLGDLSDNSTLSEAYSSIPQGTCGDVTNLRGVAYIYYNEAKHFRTVELLTQVHDSVVIQMALSEPVEYHAKVIADIKNSLQTPLTFEDRTFVVPADLTIGKCLNKELGVEIKGRDFSDSWEGIAEKIHPVLSDMFQNVQF